MTTTAYIVNRKWFRVSLLTLCYLLFTPFAVHSAFEDTGTGARPTVMAGTYVAAGDNVESLMYNPAGLAQLHTHELTSEYSRLYAGLSDGSKLGQYFLGYGQPIKYGGTVAFGWKQLSLDNLYTERTLSLGYGEWITSNVAAGLALKQLHHSFTAPSTSVDDNGNISNTPPTFFSQYGNSNTAYSMDLGMLYRWTARDTVGLSIQDINEPNIALNPADHEIVSRTVRAGVSHKGQRGLSLNGAVTRHESLANQPDYTWTGAAEKWWEMKDKTAFAARGSLATGSREFQQMAMGASYRFDAYQIDYGFVFNLTGVTLGNTMGTHRFSFSYRFGQEAKTFVRNPSKIQKKVVSHRVQRQPEIEQILENEGETEAGKGRAIAPAKTVQPTSASVPAALNKPEEPLTAGMPRPRPVVPPVAETALPQETAETAQMMESVPAATPVTVPESGPGIAIQVPAPVPAISADTYVKQANRGVPVQEPAANTALESVSRVQLLDYTDRMVYEYGQRTAANASAESRLSAFTALYPSLKGYTQTKSGELLDQMDSGDELAQSEKAYEAMKWDGASGNERLMHLTLSLEGTLTPALRDRAWDKNDLRDRRYKAWLDQALAKGRQMTANGAGAHTRMMYWGDVAHKALEFEKMPKEPIPAPKPVPLPVVTPVPAATVAVPTPQKTIEEAQIRAPQGGEWLYKVKAGDTLLSLANRFYGDYNRWRDIYILNEDRLGREGTLRTGQLLLMPKRPQ